MIQTVAGILVTITNIIVWLSILLFVAGSMFASYEEHDDRRASYFVLVAIFLLLVIKL